MSMKGGPGHELLQEEVTVDQQEERSSQPRGARLGVSATKRRASCRPWAWSLCPQDACRVQWGRALSVPTLLDRRKWAVRPDLTGLK